MPDNIPSIHYGWTDPPVTSADVQSGGDMLKADNLSGLANYTTARSNLGLAIGTDVLAQRTFGTAANNNTGDFLGIGGGTLTGGLGFTDNTLDIGAVSTIRPRTGYFGTSVIAPLVSTPNNAITATGNAATVPVTSSLSTVTNNSAATLTITITTAGAVDGQKLIVRILDFSGVAQTVAWVNTENSTVYVPTTSNGSTTLPLTVGFMYNNATSKWRCVAVA